ncbi:unnamed protein product, partial [Ectocarpus sp. 12 AP-2014]
MLPWDPGRVRQGRAPCVERGQGRAPSAVDEPEARACHDGYRTEPRRRLRVLVEPGAVGERGR